MTSARYKGYIDLLARWHIGPECFQQSPKLIGQIPCPSGGAIHVKPYETLPKTDGKSQGRSSKRYFAASLSYKSGLPNSSGFLEI